MYTIGMCPGPANTVWEREANPHILLLSRGFQKNGWHVEPLSADDLRNPDGIEKKGINILYLHWATSVYPIKQYQHIGIPPSLDKLLRSIPKLRRIYKIYLQFHLYLADLFLHKNIISRFKASIQEWREAIAATGIPVVWHQHDLLSHHVKTQNCFLRDIDLILHREIFKLATSIIVHEKSCLKEIFEFYNSEKPYAIGYLGNLNVIVEEEQRTARKRLGLPTKGTIFLFNGTARKNRNPENLVKIFSRLEDQVKDSSLLITGKGTAKYVPRKKKSCIHVRDNYLSTEELRDCFCAADYVVNDATEYLTSAVVRTAMGYKVPVIAYTYGSTGDMAKGAMISIDGIGLEAALLKAATIDQSEYENMSRHAEQRDCERTWDKAVSNILELFAKLIT